MLVSCTNQDTGFLLAQCVWVLVFMRQEEERSLWHENASLPSNTGNMVVLKAIVTLELSSPARTASRSSSTIQNHFPQNDRRGVTAIRGIIGVISAPH